MPELIIDIFRVDLTPGMLEFRKYFAIVTDSGLISTLATRKLGFFMDARSHVFGNNTG